MTRTPALLLFAAAPLLAAPTSGYVTTSDGVRLHYLTAGSGPAIVFEPGWTMPAEIWEPQIKALSKDFHVVAIDPRGQGQSARPATGYNPGRRARDIHEVIGKLKFAPAVLVGWSMGVAEVLAYVDRYGDSSLRGIVLVDGDIGPESGPTRANHRWSQARAFRLHRAEWTDSFVRHMYKQPQSEEYLSRIVRASLRVPTRAAVSLIVNTYASGKDWRPALAKIRKPVLYVSSTMSKAQADVLRRAVPSARVEFFEDAGHALFVDQPERFNSLLAEFAVVAQAVSPAF